MQSVERLHIGDKNAVFPAEIIVFFIGAFRHIRLAVNDIEIAELGVGSNTDHPCAGTGFLGRMQCKVVQRSGEIYGRRIGGLQEYQETVVIKAIVVVCAPGKGKDQQREEKQLLHTRLLSDRIEFSPPKSSSSRVRIVGSAKRSLPSRI